MEVNFDVSRAPFDENGVQGFIWPVSRAEVIAAHNAVVASLVNTTRRTKAVNEYHGTLLSVAFTSLRSEAVTLFQWYAVVRRLKDSGRSFESPQPSRVLRALEDKTAPQMHRILTDTRQGWHGVPRWRRLLSRAKAEARLNGFSPRMFRPRNADDEPITITMSPLVRQHARLMSQVVRVRNPTEWFPPKSQDGMSTRTTRNNLGDVIDNAVGAFEAGFAAGNEQLPDFLAEYARDLIVELMSLVDYRILSLMETPGQLPNHLWAGSASHLVVRIMRHATRLNGGMVTAHDHGAGIAHLQSEYATVQEFESCDTFITFTAASARALRDTLRTDLLTQPSHSNITWLEAKGGSSPARDSSPTTEHWSRDSASPIRKIMYPSTLYRGDREITFHVGTPDMVSLDWEARLFSRLSSWGFEVLHKPHPKCVAFPEGGVAERFGGRTLVEPLEVVLPEVDAIVFISTQTSAIWAMLNSNKPMVLVDIGMVTFTPDALDMLSRRCRIVQGWYDDSNRIQVNWDELRMAIEESRGLEDPAFFNSYMRFSV